MNWILYWHYSDRSSSGVLPYIFSTKEKKLLEYVLMELDCSLSKSYEFKEVKDFDYEEHENDNL